MDKFKMRCADCCYLVGGDDGAWLCANFYYDERDIHSICYCTAYEGVSE